MNLKEQHELKKSLELIKDNPPAGAVLIIIHEHNTEIQHFSVTPADLILCGSLIQRIGTDKALLAGEIV